MTIWRMRVACWVPEAINTHSEYAIIIPFPLQQWLHKRASMSYFTILIYIQQDATLHSLFYLETALHVSGDGTTRNM